MGQIHDARRSPQTASLWLLLSAQILLSGCGDPPDPAENTPNRPIAATPSQSSGATGVAAAAHGFDAALWSSMTNRLAVLERSQAEHIDRLQAKIDFLERAASEQASRARESDVAWQQEKSKHETLVRELQDQVKMLGGTVKSLEDGRILPEITIASADSPTAHELDQKIRIVERKHELALETAETKAQEMPRLSVGSEGFTLKSADEHFALRLRGLLQFDTRTFFGDDPLLEGNDGFLLRRARPIVEGTLFRDFTFNFTPDFGGPSTQIFDAWLNYRYRQELQLRAGKFRGPVGFESQQSAAALPFNERSMVSGLTPVRSLGLQLWGNVGDGLVGYAAGVFNQAGDGRNPGTSDFDDDREFAGRLSFQPFKRGGPSFLSGLAFGIGGSYSQVTSNALALPGNIGGTLPGYTTFALEQFFAYNPTVGPVVGDGAHWRLSPHVTYLHGPFGLLAEHATSSQEVYNSTTFRQAELNHTAWQVSAQWVLTGEPASFQGITPKHPFDLRAGRWGAWQLVGRLGQLDIADDAFPAFSNPDTSARRATGWSVGINWWINRNVRLLTSYSQTRFDGGGAFNFNDPTTLNPPATVTRHDESVLMTRMQLAF